MFFYSSLNAPQRPVDYEGDTGMMAPYQADTSITGWLFRPLYVMGYDLLLAIHLFASCKNNFPDDPATDADIGDETTYDFVDDEADVVAECPRSLDTSAGKGLTPCGSEAQVPDICRPSRASNWVSAFKRVFIRHVSSLLPSVNSVSTANGVSPANDASPVVSTSLAWTLFTHVKRIHRACRYYRWNQTQKTDPTPHPIADMLAPAWSHYINNVLFYKHPILYYIYQRIVPAQESSHPSAEPRSPFFKVRMGDDDYSCFPPEAAAAIRQALNDHTGQYDEVTKDDVDEGFFGSDNEYDIIDKLEPEEDFPDIHFLPCKA